MTLGTISRFAEHLCGKEERHERESWPSLGGEAGISGSVVLLSSGTQHEVSRKIFWRRMAWSGLQEIEHI